MYLNSIIAEKLEVRSITKILFGVGLLFVCAQISLYMRPVPLTLQTVGVLVIGLCYDKQHARLTILNYVLLGALGLPVFSNLTGGNDVLLSPRGGYIIGMVLAVYLITYLRERFGDSNFVKLNIYGLIASILISLVGIAQLSLFVGLENAFKLGFVPFILTGIIKSFLTASSVNLISSKIRK